MTPSRTQVHPLLQWTPCGMHHPRWMTWDSRWETWQNAGKGEEGDQTLSRVLVLVWGVSVVSVLYESIKELLGRILKMFLLGKKSTQNTAAFPAGCLLTCFLFFWGASHLRHFLEVCRDGGHQFCQMGGGEITWMAYGGEPFVQGRIIIERDSCWNVVANRNSKTASGLVYGGGIWPSYLHTKPYFLTSLLKQDVWQAPAIPDATSMEETVGLKLSFGLNFKGDKVEISSHTILVITAYLPTWMVWFLWFHLCGKYTSPMDGMVFGISPVGSKINYGARSTESESLKNDISCIILLTR